MSRRTDMFNMDRMAEDTESERRAKEQMRMEARKIRSEELEKQRREEEDGKSNSTKYSSRNSSVEPPLSTYSNRNLDLREVKSQLSQVEDKLKNAMVVNAQLDSEKQLLRYEVDLLKDKLEDFIDANHSLSKLSSERKKEISYQKMQIAELTRRLEIARQQIEARDELLTDKGLILLGATDEADVVEENSDLDAKVAVQNGGTHCPRIPGMALVSQELANVLALVPGTDLESRLKRLLLDKDELQARQDKLELQLEEERERADIAQRYDSRSRSRGLQDPEDAKLLQSARAQTQEYKFKLHESLQKISALEGD
ncbi:hypothetical protein Ciccas_009781, partial [Cichlidogyrus casuarinus]